jgi:hypothetical protein
LLEQPTDHRVGRAPDAQRACEENRRFELAELAKLRYAGNLAEAVPDVERSWNAVGKQISCVRENRRNTGSN